MKSGDSIYLTTYQAAYGKNETQSVKFKKPSTFVPSASIFNKTNKIEAQPIKFKAKLSAGLPVDTEHYLEDLQIVAGPLEKKEETKYLEQFISLSLFDPKGCVITFNETIKEFNVSYYSNQQIVKLNLTLILQKANLSQLEFSAEVLEKFRVYITPHAGNISKKLIL